MKKIVCLLIALVLCLSCVALAESVPSKTTGDLTKVEVVAENMPVDAGFSIRPIAADDVEHQKEVEFCQKEIATLAESASVVEYFGEVKNAAGEVVDITAMLESETLNVHEFAPFVASNYEESYGKVTAKMVFATPYAKDEKVVVLIGLVTVDENGNQHVEWIAYDGMGIELEGIAVEEQGCIQVELDPEIVKAIQDGSAILAVVSK